MISELKITTDGSTKLASEGLEKKLDELITSMTHLNTSIKGFKTSANETGGGDRHSRFIERNSATINRINSQSSLTEKQTELSKSKEYISLNNMQRSRSSLEAAQERSKQAEINAPHRFATSQSRYRDSVNKSELIRIGESQLNGGDAKLGARILENVSGGGKNNSNNTNRFFSTASMIGTTALISRGITDYVTKSQQLGVSSITNPMTSGYNFGSIAENLTNLKAQRNAGLGSAIADGIGAAGGAIAGRFIPGIGMAKGAFIGTALAAGISAPLSAAYLGDVSQTARRENMQISNGMDIEAMRASNIGGYAAQRSAMGNHSLLDVEVPFITAISKATNLFNDNSKAMGLLTKNVVSYAQATQMDINTAAAVGSSAAMLSHDKNFSFGRAKRVLASYGNTDYSGTFNNAVSLMQSGFGSNQAVEMAASIGGLNPGAQAAAMSYYGNGTNEATTSFISKAFGGGSEALFNVNNPGHAKAVAHSMQVRNRVRGNMGKASNILDTTLYQLQYGTDIFSSPLYDNKRSITNKGIGPTGTQSAAYAAMDNFNNTGAGDLQKTLVSLTSGMRGASASLNDLASNVSSASTAFGELTKWMTSSSNSNYSSFSGASSQVKK